MATAKASDDPSSIGSSTDDAPQSSCSSDIDYRTGAMTAEASHIEASSNDDMESPTLGKKQPYNSAFPSSTDSSCEPTWSSDGEDTPGVTKGLPRAASARTKKVTTRARRPCNSEQSSSACAARVDCTFKSAGLREETLVAEVGKDEQQHVSVQPNELGPEEGEEQSFPYKTSLCGRLGDNCCTSEAHSKSKPNARHHGNIGISR
jgi:hypothetical protein